MGGQTAYMAHWFHYYAGLADKIEGAVIPVDKAEMFNYTRHEPLGVIGAIVPWNSPLLLATWKMAPALAAGNTIVIKPSEYTSASTLELMKLVEQAGFPPGVVNVVTGFGADVGVPLVEHPARRQDRVHRVRWHRSEDLRGRRARAQARHDGARRQVAAYRVRRRGARQRGEGRHLGHPRRDRADLRRRIAAARAGVDSRPVRREDRGDVQDGEDGRSDEPRHPGRADRQQAAAREDSEVHRHRQGRRRRRWSSAARAPRVPSAATAGSSSRPSSRASTTACASRRRKCSAR